MSSTPSPRPAAVVNEQIRALWARGGRLSEVEQEAYHRLLVEWAAAVREECVQAA